MTINRWLFVLCLGGGVLFGAPSRELQEIKLNLNQVDYQLHSHQVELDLFQERLQNLEKGMNGFHADLSKASPVEKRVANLEKAHETLISDFKSLKNHLNQTSSALSDCQTKLTKIDQQLTSDIKSLKNSLQSMLVLLQQGDGGAFYTVQSGDSLGQIALSHKTDIKTLKKLNNLEKDTIFVGQKLRLP